LTGLISNFLNVFLILIEVKIIDITEEKTLIDGEVFLDLGLSKQPNGGHA
jgi:hypothetical protein